MTYLLKNPSGRIVEIDEIGVYKSCLKQPGFDILTKEEEESYFLKRRSLLGDKATGLIDVYYISPRPNNDGYGQSQGHLADAMLKLGVNLNREYKDQEVGIAYGYPEMVNQLPTPIKIIFSMFESTKIPDEWKRDLSKADLILVPSKFCQKAFKEAGFDSVVIPLAYDTDTFTYKPKDIDREPFTFLHYDAFNQRKGWDVVFKAFNEEFRTENVKLILKTTKLDGFPFPILKSQYPNVRVIKESYKPSELADLLHNSDCFVLPSRGEGFGMPPLEALATGTPVIIPNAHGFSEFFDRQYFLEVKVKGECPAIYDRFKGVDTGKMIEPDVKSVRSQMRFAYEHRSYVFDMAHKGANWVKDAYNWEKTGRKLLGEIKKIKPKNKPSVEIVDNRPEDQKTKTEDKIIFLTEDTQHITGGRYYSWWLATALKAAGHDVVIYTNRQPVFLDEFKKYPQPEVKIVPNIYDVDVKGKAYVGSPIVGSVAACKLGARYNKPTFVEVFDPFPMMEQYRGKHNWVGWDELIPLMRKPHVNIISLCNTTSTYIYEWLNKSKKQVFEINPCINSRVKNTVTDQKKENWVTFISRLDYHKRLDHVLEAVKETDCDLHVITSVDGINFPMMIREHGMEGRVVIHKFATDEQKFEIIKKSRATINGAIFEGFGMWLTESLSCGVPAVCYDYPTFKEIEDQVEDEHSNIYFAEYNNPEDLKKQLKKALSESKFTDGTKKFNFSTMVKRVRDVFTLTPKIGVITIALNEEEYIGASLRSMLKQGAVDKIAVVEGCVALNESQADKHGLSTDNTREEVLEVIKEDVEGKIIYDRYGWAGSKSELRNRALYLLGRGMDYVMVVDADEVWKTADFNKLVKYIQENPEVSVVWYPAYHFWKKPDLIAVGGQWDAYLFRFFKYEDKTLFWDKHQTPVVNGIGQSVTKLGREAKLTDVHFYHYGAMKSEKNIKAKLEYYAKRDKDLKVVNTWSDWKKGKPTQWTHGQGDVSRFNSKHPPEIEFLLKLKGSPAEKKS